nr:DUF6284 family protein [Micromonospora sp. DSM 115978]
MRSQLAPVFPAGDGPSLVDLVAIEAEWPVIEAELDLLDAEIRLIYAEDRGGPSVLDWRRYRRAEARVVRAVAEVAARPVHACGLADLYEVGLIDCGCKILRCRECGSDQASHLPVYGCSA